MTRKLSWQDLTVLHRYQSQRMVLDNSLRLVFYPGLFSSSILSIAIPSSEFLTAVDSLDTEKYPFLIGQILLTKGQHTARLAFLGPGELGADPDYHDLINHLAEEACERGAVQLMGEVEVDSPEQEILSRSGFRPNADQQIWRMPREVPLGSGDKSWIGGIQADNGPAQIFYQRVVPAQIQRLEVAPAFPNVQGLVCWEGGKVVGIAITKYGPRGILLDLNLDPSLGSPEEYLSALLFHLPYSGSREVYLRVRDYQGGITSALETLGAVPGEHQRLMVKRMAVHYNAQQAFQMQGFEKQPDITTPISRTQIKN